MSITAASLAHRQRYSVVVPARFAAPQTPRAAQQPTSVVYIRRRLLVSLVLAAVVAVVWLGAGSVVANRGGDPASASAVRPTATVTYVVQAGDGLISLAMKMKVGVKDLLAANKLTLASVIWPGMKLTLPAGALLPPVTPVASLPPVPRTPAKPVVPTPPAAPLKYTVVSGD